MTMWLHCSICPATSLCQSSGRTVSWGTTVWLAVTAESLKQLDFFFIFLAFHCVFFLFLLCVLCLLTSVLTPLKSHSFLATLSSVRLPSSVSSRLVLFHLASEVKNCQRAYFYHRFPILHSDSGDDFFSFSLSCSLLSVGPCLFSTRLPQRNETVLWSKHLIPLP